VVAVLPRKPGVEIDSALHACSLGCELLGMGYQLSDQANGVAGPTIPWEGVAIM
jgi:hypothetical protein